MDNHEAEETDEEIDQFFKRHNAAFNEAITSAKRDFSEFKDVYSATRRRMKVITDIQEEPRSTGN